MLIRNRNNAEIDVKGNSQTLTLDRSSTLLGWTFSTHPVVNSPFIKKYTAMILNKIHNGHKIQVCMGVIRTNYILS